MLIVENAVRARNHDGDALEFLVKKFTPLFKKYGNRLGYYGAETDLVIFFIELIQNFDAERLQSFSEGELVNYIAKSIIIESRLIYRKRKRKELKEITLSDKEILEDPDSDMANIDIKITLEYLLEELPEKQKKVIIYRYYMGLPDAQIAKELNISRQSVNGLRNRGLNKIKNFYTP